MKHLPQPHAQTAAPPPVRLALGLIVACFVLLALGPAFIVPYDAARGPRLIPPDEPAHWEFIRDLATGRGLPVFISGAGNYEAHQPPLYYATAVWAWWIAGERGVILARLWSVVLGALTLLAAWQVTGYLLGRRWWTRLAAVGALAFIPGRLFIMASVSNDPMFELWATVALWLCLRGISEGIAARGAALLGMSLGLALLAKTSAIVLGPLVAVTLALEPSWRREGLRRLAANAGVVALMVIALWGWWVARNMALYGEPLALNVFQSIFIKDRATPEFFLSRGITWSGYWSLVAYQTWLSLWGVFGQATVYMPPLYYRIGAALAVLGVAGLAARALRAWRVGGDAEALQDDALARRACWGPAVLLLLFVVATFLRFNTVFYQAQARYLLGAGVVLSSMLAAGICGLARDENSPWPALALMAVLAAMAVWAIVAHVTGGYSFVPPTLQ